MGRSKMEIEESAYSLGSEGWCRLAGVEIRVPGSPTLLITSLTERAPHKLTSWLMQVGVETIMNIM